MKDIIKNYDINAHIEDIKCEIVVENGDAVAVISFRNLGYGDITSIKFNAIGYNSFGDIVPIGNKEKFFLIIQDIMIRKNEQTAGLKAKLPEPDVRKLVIEEAQICFADGNVTTYKGQNMKEIELQEFDYTQQEELSAVHKLYDERIKYNVCELDEGWICGCGRFNRTDTAFCTLCGKNKTETKNVLSTDGLKKLVEEYRLRISAEKKEATKQKKVKIVIVIVIAAIIALFAGYAAVMSGRTTYSSEFEMKAEVAGTYTYHDDEDDADYQLKVQDDTVTKCWSDVGNNSNLGLAVKSWNPEKGTFEILPGTVIVTSSGDLKYNGKTYKRDNYSSNNIYSDLNITVESVSSNSSYTNCTGKIKNNGTTTYYDVKVKGAFKDSFDNVIDTDWTYAVGSEGLAPGESKKFSLSVVEDHDIKSCTVDLLNFDW